MFEPSSLLPQKKPYKAFLARKGETPSGRSNDDGEGNEWIRTAPTSSFEILDSLKPRIALKYKYLVFPVYNEFGKNAALIFHNLVVKIHGEHLQELILSIRRETCVYIQVFNEKVHILPEDSQAIITRIDVEAGTALKAYFLEMEKTIAAYAADMGEWMQPEPLPEPAS